MSQGDDPPEKTNIEMSLHSFPEFGDYLTNLPEEHATVPLDKLCPEVSRPFSQSLFLY
jgi:hypothetical protein